MATIQGVYLALFGRPADPLGLAYFNTVTNNGANLTAIGDLAASAEYQTRFAGQSPSQIITSIYQSLFNREPELSGLTFWSNALATGRFNINNIAIAIYDGATGADLTTRNLKEAAANAFTAALDTVPEINGYNGTSAAAAGRAFITSVTTTAPTAEQVAAAVTAATSGAAGGEQEVTLTVGANTVSANIINAPIQVAPQTGNAVPTIESTDKITGTGANPTLNATLNGSINARPTISGVETINLSAIGASNIDLGNTTGLKVLSIDGSVPGADISVLGLKSTVDLTVSNLAPAGGTDAFVRLAPTALTGSADTLKLTLNNNGAALATGGTINVAGQGVGEYETFDVTVNGVNRVQGLGSDNAATFAGAFITTGNGVSTYKFTGDGSLRVGTELFGATTVDAANLKGGLRASVDAARDVTVTGGAGNDRINFGEGLTIADKYNGGDGRDTIEVTNAAGFATGNGISSVEILRVNGGTSTYDLSKVASIDAVVANSNGDLVFDKASGAGAGDATKGLTILNTGKVTFTIKDSGEPTSLTDVLNVTVGATGPGGAGTAASSALQDTGGAAAAGDLTSNGTETINITVAVDETNTAATGIGKINDTDLQTFTLKGGTTKDFSVGAFDSTKLVLIDASTFAGNLTIAGTAGNEVIKTGSGDDKIGTGGSATFDATKQGNILSGGGGKDTFIFVDSDAALTGTNLTDAGAGTNNYKAINTITDLNLGGATASSGVDKIDLTAVTGLTDTVATKITIANGGVAQAITGADLGAAVNALVNAGTTLDTAAADAAAAGLFTFGADTYLIIAGGAVNDNNFGAVASNDIIIKVTGFTGTLDASDLVF